jgi:ABC-type cobalamin transport system ATPase subunit
MNVVPHTLLLPHVAKLDTVLVDHPLAMQVEAGFQQAIWHFIAMHATDKDRHELLDYICTVAKPCKMDVQMYYVCLQELNHQVE